MRGEEAGFRNTTPATPATPTYDEREQKTPSGEETHE